MKKLLLSMLTTLCLVLGIHAQIGIGTSSPDPSAALEVSSTDKGILIPRMSTAQRTNIPNPANGLMVYDTETNSQWTYAGGAWGETEPGVGKFIEGGAADIAYYEGRVGIGLANFSTLHRLYVENVKPDDRNTSVVIRGVYDGTGTASWVYGMGAVARNEGTGTVGYAIGSQGIIQNIGSSGGMTTAVGSYPQINNNGAINYASASIVENWNRSGGNIVTSRGMDVNLTNDSGATIGTGSLTSLYATNEGSITGDAYGLFIGGGGSGSVGGNSYGLYLSTPFNNVTGDAYAIYSDNANQSYLEGNLGVGTDDPQQKVHISGVLRLEPQASAPAGAGQGDIYAGTDGRLYFHDGTTWQALQFE